MNRTTIHPEGSDGDRSSTDRRVLSDSLETTDLAVNHYRVPPGDRLPAGLHAHMDQEEVFVVLSGDATFETLEGTTTVAVDEAIRFEPGEFQAGRNDGDGPLELLALGAPRESDDVRIPIDCPDCGREHLQFDFETGTLAFVCPGCGSERDPAPCPSCAGDDLRVTLGDEDDPIVVCEDCSATYDHPPVRGEW